MRAIYTAGLGALLALLIQAAPVQAQTTIRYVSATGNDSNLCTFAAPCRLFQRAVDVVPGGGVVQALNSAGYGGVTITKSVTISGGGNIVALGSRIRINSASAVVVLRGLVMDGRSDGAIGILISAAKAVHIENCAVERYTGRGIQVNSASELFVADTVSRDNGVDGLGILAGATKVTIENSRFENNGSRGLYIIGAASTVTRSVASGNGIDGIFEGGGSMNVSWTTTANNTNSGYAVFYSGEMTLESSVAHSNDTGLLVDPTSIAAISNSVFTSSFHGVEKFDGGTVRTRQNNTFLGNSFDNNGLIPLGAQ